VKSGWWVDLGRRDYGETLALMRGLVERRAADALPDTLLLVEHDDVVTLGRRQSARQNVLDTSLPVYEIERGGDVTYHGPGQLVGYPIFKLDGDERDLHAFLRGIEEGLIAACADVGQGGGRNPGWTGVWIGARKVASIGIAVRRWVTLHGFALNVATDLARFRSINPCGLDAAVMTSLAEASGRPLTVEELRPIVAQRVGEALHRSLARRELEHVLVA
jgi:lipoate-protein ligase B